MKVTDFRYSTVCESEDLSFVITATSIQQLAAAWRMITRTTLDKSKIDEIRISKYEP